MVFFSLKEFSEQCLKTVLRTGCSRCFQAKTAKLIFHDFFLDFWANVSEIFFLIDFLLTAKSKKAISGYEKLGENYKSIFRVLYSPSNKISIFRKWLNLSRKS